MHSAELFEFKQQFRFSFDGNFKSIATQAYQFSDSKTHFSPFLIQFQPRTTISLQNKREIIDGNPEICLWRFICDLSKTRTCDGGLKSPSRDTVKLISIKRHSTLGSSDNGFIDFSRKSSNPLEFEIAAVPVASNFFNSCIDERCLSTEAFRRRLLSRTAGTSADIKHLCCDIRGSGTSKHALFRNMQMNVTCYNGRIFLFFSSKAGSQFVRRKIRVSIMHGLWILINIAPKC